MSEETKVEAPVVEETVQADPVETKAREQGWVSKEEWVEGGGNETEWRTAKEFVDRGELYRSIHSTKRELKQTQAALTALQRHHQHVFEKAYQTAVSDLKAQKRLAMREQDFDAVEAIEQEMEQLTAQHVQERQVLVAQQQQQAGPPVEFMEFVERNPWYTVDKEMRDEADAVAVVYINNGGDRGQLLQHVEKKMKQKFPEKFGVKRAAPSPVASSDRTSRAGKRDDVVLDEFETEIMRTLVKSGTMTESEYKAELKKAKGIK